MSLNKVNWKEGMKILALVLNLENEFKKTQAKLVKVDKNLKIQSPNKISHLYFNPFINTRKRKKELNIRQVSNMSFVSNKMKKEKHNIKFFTANETGSYIRIWNWIHIVKTNISKIEIPKEIKIQKLFIKIADLLTLRNTPGHPEGVNEFNFLSTKSNFSKTSFYKNRVKN